MARALLERVAIVSGFLGARAATIAPTPVDVPSDNKNIGASERLALIAGCSFDDAERLELLLGIFDCHVVRTNRVSAGMAMAARLIFTADLSFVPNELPRPFDGHTIVVFLAREDATIARANADQQHARTIASPVSIEEVETILAEVL